MNVKILELSKLTESERLEIATLLIKAGYTVRLLKKKTTGRNYNHYIEYWKDEDNESSI